MNTRGLNHACLAWQSVMTLMERGLGVPLDAESEHHIQLAGMVPLSKEWYGKRSLLQVADLENP